MNIGDTVTDGTAVFKIKTIKQRLVGEIKWYAGKSTPVGYLVCDGSAVSRTNYAELFAAIGTTYGTGNGSTTFNLPCLTDGRFVEGNATPGTKRNAGLPNITGTLGIDGNSTGALSGAFSNTKTTASGATGTSENNVKASFSAKSSNSIYGNSSTVQPVSLTLRPVIRYI